MSESRAVMWMLTSGEYSDWDVHGIYTNKAEADRAAELANRGRNDYDYEDEYRVEEVPNLDGIMPRRAKIIDVIGYPLKEGAEAKEYPRGTRLLFERQGPAPYSHYHEHTGRLYVSGETEVARNAYAQWAARIKADAEGITRWPSA